MQKHHLKVLVITHSLPCNMKECIQKQSNYFVKVKEFMEFPHSDWHKKMTQEKVIIHHAVYNIQFNALQVYKPCYPVYHIDAKYLDS